MAESTMSELHQLENNSMYSVSYSYYDDPKDIEDTNSRGYETHNNNVGGYQSAAASPGR